MKKIVSLIVSVAMLMSMFSSLSVYAADMDSFKKVVYDHAESVDANKGWTGESAGANISTDESGNVVIKSNGTGTRYAALDITDTTTDKVEVAFTINAKLHNYSASNEQYSYFSLTDASKADIVSIKMGNVTQNDEFTASVNDTAIAGINSAATDYTSDIDLSGSIILNFAEHEAEVKIGDNSFEVAIPETAQSIGYVRASMQRDRDTGAASTNKSSITVSNLNVAELCAPEISVSENCTENGDGTYTVTVPEGETVSVASFINYSYNQADPQYEVITDSTLDASARVEFLPLYNAVIIKGITQNENAGSFKLHIENADSVTEATFNVVVAKTIMNDIPQAEELTPVENSPILDIDFEGEDSALYSYADEYGRVTNDTASWTSIEDTATGLTYKGQTAENPANSGISGNAFYGWLTPQNGTEIGNGYRGSRLILDNEKVQRTDKIKVSYDFGIYNIVNVDNMGVDVGMPQVVSMTSEAVESGSIPYDFNEQHYREPDADVSDMRGISRHLLTFLTGRTKRNGEGIHMLDMTNQLAYFEPRYADGNSVGRYKELDGMTLVPNAFNFFHVDAEIDFHNNIIKFTITNTQDTDQTATITTVIPEHASWDGFIVSSQKWDTSNPINASDIDGQDTEHYIYLDNIKAEKLAVDNTHIETVAPTARPLPEDAVINVSTTGESTWKFAQAHSLQTPDEKGYIDYNAEVATDYGFTNEIATTWQAKGITSYTEFDFYLPKKGSYLTFYNRGSKSGGEDYGNTIIISDAGVCSWAAQEYYIPVYDKNLECGKWYSITLIYDHQGSTETVILKDGDTELARVGVGTRNLDGNYYRSVWINRPEITRGSGLPVFYPSMATTYVANLRIYNRGVIQEFYPYGSAIAEHSNGDVVNADGESANASRLGSYIGTFVTDQVADDGVASGEASIVWGSIPNDPTPPEGYKFTGWKLMYQNGSGASESDITVTGDSTRLKYVAGMAIIGGKIHGTVWNDANGNGTIDEGEEKMPNVKVTVTDKNDSTKTYEVTTDENGNYTTPDMPVGDYTVKVTTPYGYAATTEVEKEIHVAEDSDTENNAGFKANLGKIHGTVWNDTDGDGTIDEGETKMPNVKVTITDKNDPTKKYEVTTDSDGNYTTPDIPAGDYTVTADAPEGYTETTEKNETVTVAGGEDKENNVGLKESIGKIHGTVWDDANGNGTIDEGEEKMPNVKVTITDKNDPTNKYEVTTDSDGNYTTPDIPAGDYTVTADAPEGYTETTEKNETVTVAGGEDKENNVGLKESVGKIHGTVWDDTDGDGTIDEGETKMPNVKVTITDKNDPTKKYEVTTDSDGNYTTPDIPAGDYTVTADAPEGYTETTEKGETVTVAGGEDKENNVGLKESVGKIHGTVWNDADGDGTIDEGETKMPNVKVTITDKNDPTKKYEVTTDEDGNYTTPDIPAGDYTVTADAPEGYAETTEKGETVTVAGGEDKENNVGLKESVGKIHGTVWNDADGDGTIDEGEAKMPNVKVTITDKNDPTKTYEVTTDENGNYTTPDIPAGDYTVTADAPEGYTETTEKNETVTVADGEDKENNVGLKKPSPDVTAVPTVSPTPEVTGTPEVSPTPEVTGTPEVSPTPEATGAPEVSPTPEVTATPTATSRPYYGGGSSSAKKPTPKPTATPEASPTPDATDNPDATAVPTDAPDSSTSGENVPQLNKTEHYAYIVGYPEGDVRPEKHITREEVATVFFRLLTDESRTDYWMQTNSYDDMSDDRWSNNAISTMTNANVILGYEDNTFRPAVAITRAEFAAMAARFDSGKYNGENKFSDIDGHWAAEEINRAAERGWISGYEDGTFKPDQYITRAEAMTLINKMLERVVEAEDIHEDAIFWPDNSPEMWYYTAVEEATNSHDYEKNEDATETWTNINSPRNWEELEKEWSTAESAGHEDSVFYNK